MTRIEAAAALKVVPNLQISLAAKESSGTNQFQGSAINWDRLILQLDEMVTLA